MQSRSLQERPGRDVDRISSERYAGHSHMQTVSPAQHSTDACFVAEGDEFLDAVTAALDQLAADCKAALRWSNDSTDVDAAIQATEQSFCAIASICKEAGLAVRADICDERYGLAASGHSTSKTLVSLCSEAVPVREPTSSQDHHSCCQGAVNPPPAPLQVEREDAPMEDIVEVEITDLLAQSHEEMLILQRVFEDRMAEVERERHEYERKHAAEMQALQEELTSSRLAMDRVKQELLGSTSRKLEDMHSTIATSQKVIEAGMKDQTRYWKTICEELVLERREMAQKVAEERGRYTALKAHLAGHDDANTRPLSHSRVRIRSEEVSAKMGFCGLSPSTAPENQGSNEETAVCTSVCSTPTGSSSRLVVVPNANSVSEPSSAEVSPTHSSSSSKTGKTTFRRYYLAQKRDNRVVLQ